MRIKNYTCGVPVARTVSRIEELLAEAGATAIGKNYANARLESITFQIAMNGKEHLVRLPARPEAVFDALWAEVARPKKGTREKLREQAARTAWKIQQEWLEIELTNLHLGQKETMEVFLPYIWDGQQTYYEFLKGANFKALPEKT